MDIDLRAVSHDSTCAILLPVARVPVGPVLPPRRAAAEREVQHDDEGGEERAEADAHVEVRVVGVQAKAALHSISGTLFCQNGFLARLIKWSPVMP